MCIRDRPRAARRAATGESRPTAGNRRQRPTGAVQSAPRTPAATATAATGWAACAGATAGEAGRRGGKDPPRARRRGGDGSR
eukprot:1751334-Alexandrium_andersonii.AAC.1